MSMNKIELAQVKLMLSKQICENSILFVKIRVK